MSKHDLLALAEVRRGTTTVEGVTVHVRELVTSEFSKYSEIREGDREKATAYLCQLCVIDEDGNTILSDEEAKRVAKTVRLSSAIVKKIMELSGFKEDDKKETDAS